MSQYSQLPMQSTPAPAPRPKPLTSEASLQELRAAIRGSNEIIAQATEALSIAPDTITIDRAKLTVTKRWLFSVAEVMSIRVEDVLNVTATVGPIFGSLLITDRIVNTAEPHTIGRFWRKDAQRMKRIIQGYVIALQRGIDCHEVPADKLARMLDRLGEDAHA